MNRPPRDIATERLVSLPLLAYAYIWIGLFGEAMVCMGAYLWVFTHHGVPHSAIFLIDGGDTSWQSQADRIEDGDRTVQAGGNEYDAEQQQEIVRQVRALALLL